MPNREPCGTDYSSELAASVKKYFEVLIDKGRRRSRYNPAGSEPITQELLATAAKIDPGNFSDLINCKKKFSKEELFRLISMPWVTMEAAQSWIFLWVANELDKYETTIPDDEITLTDEWKTRGWSPEKKLKRLGDSFEKLASYSATLGVIDQIDYARRQKNKSIQKEEYRLPAEGPSINRQILNEPVSAATQKYWSEHSRTKLVLKFSQDLADLETKERINEINGYLNEELEMSNLENNSRNLSDEVVGYLLKDLVIDTSDRVNSAEIVNQIITKQKNS